MKRSFLGTVALLIVIALGAGCATRSSSRVPRPRSFVLAVTVHGSLQPTPQQWALIQARFSRLLTERGWVLVNDVSLADHIIRVEFTPDPDAPEDRGHATVLAVRSNPRSMVARRGHGPYANGAPGQAGGFGFAWPGSNYYSNSYYGYGDYYGDGYSGGWSTYTPVILTPAPTTPPLRHHPGFRDDCPPGHTPGHFAGHRPDPAGDHPRPPPSDYGQWRGERAAPRADRAYSRSDHSYPRSDAYSPPSYSYSSEPAYSPPSYSDAASSASNSSAAAAVASSAPAVEAVSAER